MSDPSSEELRRLAFSNAYHIAAVVEILERKGLLTIDEVAEAIQEIMARQQCGGGSCSGCSGCGDN